MAVEEEDVETMKMLYEGVFLENYESAINSVVLQVILKVVGSDGSRLDLSEFLGEEDSDSDSDSEKKVDEESKGSYL